MVVALVIVGILLVIAFLSGMGDEFWNLVSIAAILAASLVLIITPLCIQAELYEIFEQAAEAGEDKTALYAFIFAMIYIGAGFVFGSPLIWAWKEKEYYLILGTLASTTDYTAGLGLAVGLGLVFGVPAGLCFGPAVANSSIWFLEIPGAIAVLITLVTFIFMIRKYVK